MNRLDNNYNKSDEMNRLDNNTYTKHITNKAVTFLINIVKRLYNWTLHSDNKPDIFVILGYCT
jgi:hypothetical protein